MMASFVLALLLLQGSQLLHAGGGWAAFDRGSSCTAVSQALASGGNDTGLPSITIRFDRSGSRAGQSVVRLKRPAREGSKAMLTVGGKPYLLETRGRLAIARDAGQQQAILSDIRQAGAMRLVARDRAGRRMSHRFPLAGAPTAIDAAAACAARR